jgi:N-acetylmuramoyl-L-alanine amidase
LKKTYLKKLVVACVATLALTGLKHNTAEAITEYQVVEGDTLWELGLQYDINIDNIKQENDRLNDLINIGEVLRIPDRPIVSAAQPSEPIIEAPVESTEVPAVSMSNEEKDLFARLVEAEAKGESYEGKVAVATVVLNRVDSPQFPNTVTEVINQVVGNSYAFSPVQNGEINNTASDESIRAVDEALMRKDRLNESIFFYNPEIATDTWIRTRDVVATIGNHVFAK